MNPWELGDLRLADRTELALRIVDDLGSPIEGAIARMNRALRASVPEPRAPLPSPAGDAPASSAQPQQVENRTEG